MQENGIILTQLEELVALGLNNLHILVMSCGDIDIADVLSQITTHSMSIEGCFEHDIESLVNKYIKDYSLKIWSIKTQNKIKIRSK